MWIRSVCEAYVRFAGGTGGKAMGSPIVSLWGKERLRRSDSRRGARSRSCGGDGAESRS